MSHYRVPAAALLALGVSFAGAQMEARGQSPADADTRSLESALSEARRLVSLRGADSPRPDSSAVPEVGPAAVVGPFFMGAGPGGDSAGSLPEGSFKGTTPALTGPDVLALLLKKDPAKPDTHYAILAEYDRVGGVIGVFPERLQITRWVPRMYAYRVDKLSDLQYAMKPLRVSSTGDIEVDDKVSPDTLSLAKSGTLDGAVLTRFVKNSAKIEEAIKFRGKVGSTWENYVAGDFFGSKDSTGGDYFKEDVNTVLSKDGVADFRQEEIKGQFAVSEKAPGLFTFTAKGSDIKGSEKVVTRIGVFVDIVNWKPLFTTNELLLINPDDPRDVGFYYERH